MLIGLHGRKQAGKDTVFRRTAHLMRDVVDVQRVSFADLLYESAAAALGVSVDFLQTYKTDPDVVVSVMGSGGIYTELPIRGYLQRYGTEAHRDVFGPNFWVDAVDLEHAGRIVMVTDVRFPNEAEAVRRAGGSVWRVIGPAEVEDAGDGHASETPLPLGLVDDELRNDVRDDDFRALDERLHRLIRTELGVQGLVPVAS